MKQEVLGFLDRIINSKNKTHTLGLDRMKILMKKLGNPQDKINIIHVAGTNGKGSVCSMLSTILIESNYKAGLFTSPHLIDYNERIQVQNTPITDEEFGKVGCKIIEKYNEMEEEGVETPTFFEFITAMAITHFYEKGVDIAILETGIGGRYDATNIIEKPLISVITSIDKDHMMLLGDTIEQITLEKAGIIKENRPLVLYHAKKSVYNNINAICRKKNAKFVATPETTINNLKSSLDGMIFDIQNNIFNYPKIHTQLIGEHQISNTLTTLLTVEELKKEGYNIKKEHIYKGLYKTKWPGRMEVIQKNPTIIIDGAHNDQSAKAFVKSLKSISKDKKVYILIGVFKDKEYDKIIDLLIPHAKAIITTQSANPRALESKELYKQIKLKNKDIELYDEKNLEKAYTMSKKLLKKDDFMYCVGSLYLIGEIKEMLAKKEEL